MVAVFINLRRFCVAMAVLAAGLSPAHAQGVPSPLQTYRAAIVKHPGAAINYYRLFLYARNNPAHRGEARRLLETFFHKYPRGYRIEMFIAWIDELEGRPSWEETFRHSIQGMETENDDFGVVYAGEILAYILIDQGRWEDADVLLERCIPYAKKTGKRWMEARLWSVQAVLANARGDHSTELHLLRRTRKAVFPDGEYDIKCSVMNNLGNAYWYLGRYGEAYEAYTEAAQLRARAGDLWGESTPVANMAGCAIELVHQGKMKPDELERLLDRGLNLSVRGGNAENEAYMLNLLGRQRTGRKALQIFRRARKIARRHADHADEIQALEFSGAISTAMGPPYFRKAQRFFEEAKRCAIQTRHNFLLAEILGLEARMKALDAPHAEAVRAHLKVMDFIEHLRTPEVRGSVRAQAFSRWKYIYYRLAGFLLAGMESSKTPVADCALAFRTIERFRARELLERLKTPRMMASKDRNGLTGRWKAAMREISALQQRLADPALPSPERKQALDALTDAEERESVLRDRLAGHTLGRVATSQQGTPSLRAIQALLGPDQAMLSYQLWDGEPWEYRPLDTGTSWLLLITKQDVQPIALPARRVLRDRVAILDGLIEPGRPKTPSAGPALARLYRDLLQTALDVVPAGIHRLVIIPDGVLFRCPFAALTPGPEEPAVVSRYEISIVPSAAVWAHLKTMQESRIGIPRTAALILFAPRAGYDSRQAHIFRTAALWREGLRLAPLRHAVEEARTLERIAGEGTTVLSGSAASEAALKSTSLGRFGILDLVTHAIVDEDQPERSAVVLAPGSEREDGLLQVREIPHLRLDGQLVILSSCGSSAGRILGGEGAESLARAFLEAGAGAVLASLWPLEDARAATLFSSLSRELGKGRRVSDALRHAQCRAIREGVPPAWWAGIVVLGNGDLRPLPARTPWLSLWLLAGIGTSVSLGVLLLRRML